MVTQDTIREAYELIDKCALTHEGDVSGLFTRVGVTMDDIALAITLGLRSGLYLLEPNSFGLGLMVGLLACGSASMEATPLTDEEVSDLLGGPPTKS